MGKTQADWRICDKCWTLFFDGFANNKGRCAAGGGHVARGFNFALPYDQLTTGQSDWRYCAKCAAVFFDGRPNKGRCPAGGGHQFRQGLGYNYVLFHDNNVPGEHNWRYCAKCSGMFYDGRPEKGRCPAGGTHSAAGFNFVLDYRENRPPLKDKLHFDTQKINIKGGVPVGGWSNLYLYPNGAYEFSGHFHDSGAPSYDIGLAWFVRDDTGRVLSFNHHGHTHGTFEKGSRDDDWKVTGTNAIIAESWAVLSSSARATYQAQVNMDVVGVFTLGIRIVRDSIGMVTDVVKVVDEKTR